MVIVRVGTSSSGGGTENLGEAVEVEGGVCQRTGNTMNRRTVRAGEKRTKGISALRYFGLIELPTNQVQNRRELERGSLGVT